ncbi:hypothetical protein [Leptospira saintgironsiae]|uniref:Lipoprotein n=1 Tax=Leptospira saintgironsiae TaxID=2023183 RepID=A0A2M9YCI5_9LEPT|nr:hypothetical protein [Leptospira saintgironsiae]PJZ49271.1 hypothetical protein CH362_08000 [Leptospira saintgironsiae]
MKFNISKIIPFSFLLFFAFFISCLSSVKDPKDEFVYVQNVQGKTEEELELNAKRKILENGLGELIQGRSSLKNGRLEEFVTNSSVEGFVTQYTKIGSTRVSNGFLEIDAKGKVNKKAVENALKERYKEIGRPKFLILVEERILGKRNEIESVSITENEFVKNFPEFDFLDKAKLNSFNKSSKIFDLSDSEQKVLSKASSSEAQVLVLGQAEVTDLGKIMDSEIHSYQSVLRFKIFDVQTGRVIAAENSSGVYPHVNPDTGIQESIRKAVDKIYPKIKEQISVKWKPGNLIRISIEGIRYDEYVSRDIRGIFRSVPGVNSVNEFSDKNSKGLIVLEVEALFSGSILYQKLQEKKGEFGLEFFQKEITPSSLYLIFKKGK